MPKALPSVIVTIYDIESGDPDVVQTKRFAGDCLTPPRPMAEAWLRNEGFVPLESGGSEWEEFGIGNKQATIKEEA